VTVNRFYASVLNVVKEDIRRSLLKRRRSLPEKKIRHLENEVNSLLIDELQKRDLKKLLVFKSIDYEPSINKTLEFAWLQDIKVYIPKIISKKEIIINRIKENSSLCKNMYGIDESDEVETSELYEIDTAVLPFVGVDKNGFRLGYGGGYYDRFFSRSHELSEKPFIIGLGYAFQVLEISFAESHDLKCDSVITENGVLKF